MKEQTCRFCRCTDSRACPGGCHWHKAGYCSSCADAHLEELVEAAYGWARNQRPHVNVTVIFRDRRWGMATSQSGIAIFDYLSVPVLAIDHDGASLASHYDAPELMGLFTEQARAA